MVGQPVINKVRYGNTSKLVFQKGMIYGDELIVRWRACIPIVEGLKYPGQRMGNKYEAKLQRITYLTK
jgi:hypothetical protein